MNKKKLKYRVTYLEMNKQPNFDWPKNLKHKLTILLAENFPAWYFLFFYKQVGKNYYWTDWLRKINECEDEKSLKFFLREKDLKNKEFDTNTLKLLWECCQIPDFVKKTYGHHLEVVDKVFNFLTGEESKIPNYYMKKQLSMLDKLDGNVDSISNRISNVRTWSYVANKSNWVENQDYWVERTKNLEDKLSDRLHDELTKTFIDKRASVLAKGLKQLRLLLNQERESHFQDQESLEFLYLIYPAIPLKKVLLYCCHQMVACIQSYLLI